MSHTNYFLLSISTVHNLSFNGDNSKITKTLTIFFTRLKFSDNVMHGIEQNSTDETRKHYSVFFSNRESQSDRNKKIIKPTK